MKRLALLAGALVVSSVAVAADDTDMKHDGEFRVRYFNDMTPSGDKGAPLNKSDVEGRMKLGLTMRKGEKIQAHLGLLHNSLFGADKTTAAAAGSPGSTGYNTVAGQNVLLVNQAYGWWKASDALAMKVGRFHVEMADGSIFSADDWMSVPHTHEGLWAGYDTDFAKFGLSLIKEADPLTGAGNPDSDPERNMTLLSVDLKNMPEAVKMANVHLLKISGSETATRPIMDAMFYGATVAGDVGSLNYKATLAMQSGVASKTAATETKFAGNMFDLGVGWGMPDTMGLKITAQYHMDSGDDAAGDDKNEAYQPMYYDSHKYAGLMDLLGWGNLSYWGLGASIAPSEDLTVGANLLAFSKTKENGGVNQTSRPNGTTAGALANKKDLGMEFDLTATKKYGNGFQIDALFGAFMPGAAFKDATVKKEATIMQVMLAGTMAF